MGNYASKEEVTSKQQADEIDEQIKEDMRKLVKQCKVLVLGSGDSGKTTIVKQMKIIYMNGFSRDELLRYRGTIYRNLVDSAQALIIHMQKLQIDCELPENQPYMTGIMACHNPPGSSFMEQEIAEQIHQVWQDPVVRAIVDDYPYDFYLMDNASYFFTEALRIGAPDYVPNEDDVLRAQARSTGITQTRFTMDQTSICMYDVGGVRSERRKWIHVFEDVTCIIFCSALSEYDQVLLEDKSQNRMQESLILFESVINSKWFARTSIVLFLNKADIFKRKMPKEPLEKCFPEYTGGSDIDKGARYILWRFMQANRAGLSVHSHITQATDTGNIRNVFSGMKETVFRNKLEGTDQL